MTVGAWTLYRGKLRLFLAPVRRHPVVVAVLILVAVALLAGMFTFGYFLPELPIPMADLVETFALSLSILAGLGLLTSPGGGMMLQPAEVDFAAVAPVTVRQFAFADALFQVTLFGVSLPGIVVFSLGYGIRTGAPPLTILAPPLVIIIALFSYTLFIQSLGIARLLRKRWALPLSLVLFAILIAPAVARLLFRSPVTYASLPYPTTGVAQAVLVPFGQGGWSNLPALGAFVAIAVAANLWATRRPFLPNLRGTFGLAFTSEGKRLQQEALLRAFGRIRRGEGARLYRPTLLNTMATLHLVRMARDGTLFLAAILGFVFGLPSLLANDSLATGGLYVALFLPVAAAGQWMISDRPNLWIVRATAAPPEAYFTGWWVSLSAVVAAIGVAIGLVAWIVSGTFDAIGIGAAVGGALGASAGALFCAARFPYAPNEFSVRPFLHMIVTAIFGGLAAIPVVAIGFVLASNLVLAGLTILPVLAVSSWLLHKFVRATTKTPAA